MTEPGLLSFTLNGVPVDASGTPATRTLLQFVRDRGLVGTKEGCGDGDCGACTVALAGEAADGSSAYQAVNSCLVPIGSCAGRSVITVEGVSSGRPLHPVQQAMVESGGSQCGYCTPGFVMSLFAGYHEPTRTDEPLGDDCIEGNLCRCTGYAPIRRVACSLGPAVAGPPAPRLSRTRPPEHVTAGARDFHHPATLAQVLRILTERPDAVLVAGGTDLGVELSHHRLDPAVSVALDGVEELQTLHIGDDELRIGAGLPLSHIERRARGIFPALDEMIHWFAARQIRNRATVGGNLATASPIADLPPVLLALDATVSIASPDGVRETALDGFFTSYRETVLAPGEVITAVAIPRRPEVPSVSWSYKVGKRGTDDISIVAAAFRLDLDRPAGTHATITAARLAFGGVAATPARAHAVEDALVGHRLDTPTVARATAALREAFTPLDDLRGSAAYRRALAGNLFEKFAHDVANGGHR